MDGGDYPSLRRELLTPMAERYDLGYDIESLSPGTEEESFAFAFVGCGADLLSGYREPGDVPTADRRTAKRASKWLTRSFSTDSGREAASFLAQAMGTHLCEVTTRAGSPEVGQVHSQIVGLIQQYYPLSDGIRAILSEARREYEVLDTHESDELLTGYHLALNTPGQDPDEDAELVEAQVIFAGSYFRGVVGLRAIELAVGSKRYESIRSNLIHPSQLSGDYIKFQLQDGNWWNHVSSDWKEVALKYIEATESGPES